MKGIVSAHVRKLDLSKSIESSVTVQNCVIWPFNRKVTNEKEVVDGVHQSDDSLSFYKMSK